MLNSEEPYQAAEAVRRALPTLAGHLKLMAACLAHTLIARVERAHAAECRELANRCWHEESKQRYEELAHHWLELAEQRQRSA